MSSDRPFLWLQLAAQTFDQQKAQMLQSPRVLGVAFDVLWGFVLPES